MVSQAKGGCSECGSFAHTKMYHKPKKPLKRTAIKPKPLKYRYVVTGFSPTAGIKMSNEPLTGEYVTIKFKKKPTNKRTKRVESRSQLVKKLDSIFSQYIRLKDAEWRDGELQAMCVTSGEWKPWKQQQNGHFYSRGRYPTRWDEMNCHVQSYRSNVLFKGDYINYTRYMIDRYGREAVDELERKSLSGTKIPTPVLREMIEEYKIKVKELQKEG